MLFGYVDYLVVFHNEGPLGKVQSSGFCEKTPLGAKLFSRRTSHLFEDFGKTLDKFVAKGNLRSNLFFGGVGVNLRWNICWDVMSRVKNQTYQLNYLYQSILTFRSNTSIWMFPKIEGIPPKSSIVIGFSIIAHPFWGFPPIFGNTHTQGEAIGSMGGATRVGVAKFQWLNPTSLRKTPVNGRCLRMGCRTFVHEPIFCWNHLPLVALKFGMKEQFRLLYFHPFVQQDRVCLTGPFIF